MWSEYPAHLEYPVLLMGCGAPGSGSATYTPSAGSNPYTSLPFIVAGIAVALISFGLVAILLSQRAHIGAAGRHWIRWPYLLASVLALLGIAWTWQLSSTYNDAGCVVYVRAWPVDESMIWPVVSLFILGGLALALVYLGLDIALFIRDTRLPKSSSKRLSS